MNPPVNYATVNTGRVPLMESSSKPSGSTYGSVQSARRNNSLQQQQQRQRTNPQLPVIGLDAVASIFDNEDDDDDDDDDDEHDINNGDNNNDYCTKTSRRPQVDHHHQEDRRNGFHHRNTNQMNDNCDHYTYQPQSRTSPLILNAGSMIASNNLHESPFIENHHRQSITTPHTFSKSHNPQSLEPILRNSTSVKNRSTNKVPKQHHVSFANFRSTNRMNGNQHQHRNNNGSIGRSTRVRQRNMVQTPVQNQQQLMLYHDFGYHTPVYRQNRHSSSSLLDHGYNDYSSGGGDVGAAAVVNDINDGMTNPDDGTNDESAVSFAKRAQHAGFLNKLGVNVPEFKRRFFVLDHSRNNGGEQYLYYYLNEHDTTPRGWYNLNGSKIIRLFGDDDEKNDDNVESNANSKDQQSENNAENSDSHNKVVDKSTRKNGQFSSNTKDQNEKLIRFAIVWDNVENNQQQQEQRRVVLEARDETIAKEWIEQLQYDRVQYWREQCVQLQNTIATQTIQINELNREITTVKDYATELEQYRSSIHHIETDRDGAVEDAMKWKEQWEQLDYAISVAAKHIQQHILTATETEVATAALLPLQSEQQHETNRPHQQESKQQEQRKNTDPNTENNNNDSHKITNPIVDDENIATTGKMRSVPRDQEPDKDCTDDIATNVNINNACQDQELKTEFVSTVPGSNFALLYKSIINVDQYLQKTLDSLNHATNETEIANCKVDTIEKKMFKAEKHLCEIWEENCSIRKVLKQTKREKRVLVREVKNLLANIQKNQHQQQQIQQSKQKQKSSSGATTMFNGVSEHNRTVTPNKSNDDDDDNDDDEQGQKLIDELEKHVLSSIRLNEQFLLQTSGAIGTNHNNNNNNNKKTTYRRSSPMKQRTQHICSEADLDTSMETNIEELTISNIRHEHHQQYRADANNSTRQKSMMLLPSSSSPLPHSITESPASSITTSTANVERRNSYAFASQKQQGVIATTASLLDDNGSEDDEDDDVESSHDYNNNDHDNGPKQMVHDEIQDDMICHNDTNDKDYTSDNKGIDQEATNNSPNIIDCSNNATEDEDQDDDDILRPNPCLHLDDDDDNVDDNDHANEKNSYCHHHHQTSDLPPQLCTVSSQSETSSSGVILPTVTITKRNTVMATTNLTCPLADVVDSDSIHNHNNKNNTGANNGTDKIIRRGSGTNNNEICVYHLTFHSRKIGIQFIKVPPPTTKINGLLTEAMTSDIINGDDTGNNTTNKNKNKSVKTKTMVDEHSCPVATPVDAVLVCGLHGFDVKNITSSISSSTKHKEGMDPSDPNLHSNNANAIVQKPPRIGARLVAFDGVSVEVGKWTFHSIRKAIEARNRPLTLSFRNDYLTTEQRTILTRALAASVSTTIPSLPPPPPDNTTPTNATIRDDDTKIQNHRHHSTPPEDAVTPKFAMKQHTSTMSHDSSYFVNEDGHYLHHHPTDDDTSQSAPSVGSDYSSFMKRSSFSLPISFSGSKSVSSAGGGYETSSSIGGSSAMFGKFPSFTNYRTSFVDDDIIGDGGGTTVTASSATSSVLSSVVPTLVSNLLSRSSSVTKSRFSYNGDRSDKNKNRNDKSEPFTPEYLRRAPEAVEDTPQHQDFQSELL